MKPDKLCVGCGKPAAFPSIVSNPFTCATCQSSPINTDTARLDWLSRCNAGQWEELQDIRLSHRQGFLRHAIDRMMLEENAKQN